MASLSSLATYPSLRDKTVLITGGAAGIAASAVELFCHQGSNVIFFDISEPDAESVIATVKSNARSHPQTTIPAFYRCDVSNLSQLQTTAQQVLSSHGTVDILINSAAAAGASSRVPSSDVTPESWEFDINVNLRHVFFLTQAVLPAMRARGAGSIINMGSISWRIPVVGTPVYNVAKAAIMGMTKTHSKEFGQDGIRVNSIMPGSVATEKQIREVLTDEYRAKVMAAQTLQRDILPREVASVILFLASDDSSAVTGSSYIVDGGWVSDP